jgi:acyl-CoA reductase-like NAD-dependent aldehyde dehydrogenase
MVDVLMPRIGGASLDVALPTLDQTSPIDGSALWRAVQSDADTAAAAVAAAQRAFAAHRRTPVATRAAWLEQAAAKILVAKEDIARSIVAAVGKPLRAAMFEASRSADFVRACAHEIVGLRGETLPLDAVAAGKGRYGQTKRVPLGVVLAITPFNAPANLLVQKIAPAIAAGNAVIVKPAPEGLQTAILIAEAFEAAGLPIGLINVIPGGPDTALALARHPGIAALTLTGGNRAAEALAAALGPRRFVAELGSNSAAIVCADADVLLAAERLAVSAFEASGQQCISAQRIFVDEAVFAEFVERFVAAAKKLKVGDPYDMATDIGPMVNARSADRIEALLRDAEQTGATLALPAKRNGCIVSPAVVTDAPATCRLMTEEAFGPVAIVNRFGKLDDVIKAANATPYGLQAACFTSNLHTAYRMFEELDVGSVWINEGTRFRLDIYPFGGTKSSGFGREGVRYAIEEMSQWKFLGISLPAGT